MQSSGFLFFGLFALVLVMMYLGIRRQWASPASVAGGGTLGSIIMIGLVSLSQGNSVAHALVVSILIGGLFSAVTLAMAWYFHNSEVRSKQQPAPSAYVTEEQYREMEEAQAQQQ